MLHRYQDKEKSLTRRFLLILGVVTFICFLVLGAMIIWGVIPLELPKYQKVLFGSLIVVYSVLRFSRLLKKRPDEE